jgi:hypothetical protein
VIYSRARNIPSRKLSTAIKARAITARFIR